MKVCGLVVVGYSLVSVEHESVCGLVVVGYSLLSVEHESVWFTGNGVQLVEC